MAVLPILTAPHPVLEKKARDVRDEEFGAALEQLCADMAETMYAAPGVGLAAPQVGDARRILVIDSGQEDGKGLLKMVNPVVVARSAEKIVWHETCLSVPDFDVEVDRARHVTVEWRSPTGERLKDDFSDFEAVIFQHEHDHLMGTILLDKVSAFRRSRYLQKVRRGRVAPAPA